MPTPLDALCMSYLAYNDATPGDKDLNSFFDTQPQRPLYPPENLITKIGKIHELVRNGWKYFNMTRNSMSGYQCIVFVNHEKKEFVLAHRGTVGPSQVLDFKANVKCDVEILSGERAQLTKELLSLLGDLVAFITEIIRKKNAEYRDYRITQVGHSLGGFLAELGAAYVADPKALPGDSFIDDLDRQFKEECQRDNLPYSRHPFRLHSARQKDAKAITFDSLGSVNILNKLNIGLGKASSDHYFLEPNIANTANPHDGTKYILLHKGNNCFDYDASSHNSSFAHHATHNIEELSLTASTHSLNEMISRFNSRTGKAFNGQLISEWPTAVNTFNTGERPRRPTDNTMLGLFRNFVTTMTHEVTDGVVSFTHSREGNLNYENRQNRQQCPLS